MFSAVMPCKWYARRKRDHEHCIGSRLGEVGPQEFVWVSEMLYICYLDLTGEGRKRSLQKIPTSASVCAAQPSSTLPYSTHLYILHNHHHHHVVLVAWISLTLSRHSSLSFIALGRSSGQHPVSSHECMFVLVVLLLHSHVWGSIRVHLLWVRPCFSSSVLHVWFI